MKINGSMAAYLSMLCVCVNTKMMAIIVLVVVVPHAKYIHSNLFQVNGWPLYKRKKDQMIKMVKQRKKIGTK